jgi:hypothetical protein
MHHLSGEEQYPMKHYLHPIAIPLLSFFIILLGITSASAQYTNPSREEERRQRVERARREEMDRARRDIQIPRYRPAYKPPDFYSKKMTEAQKKLLAVSSEDRAAFASFLRQSDTGIVRLLPQGKYESDFTVKADRSPDDVLPIRGGGAFYSFTEKTHSLGPWSEIGLQDDKLITGFASASLGLITSIGDAPLETISLSSPGVEYLAGFVPPARYIEAYEQDRNNLKGIAAGSYTYQSVYPAVANTTYVLRSTAYHRQPRNPLVVQYPGSDVLIAFRIIRKDADGSVVILWKRLQKFRAPKLKDEPGK